MALKATIFKADLQIADLDRNHYSDHALTLARHPSETDERMMVRLLAFALNAALHTNEENLSFGRGLSADDEPDLWAKDLTGAIRTWIDVGLPDEKVVRRACGRADKVLIYCYGGSAAQRWWQASGAKLDRSDNLAVIDLPLEATQAMARLAQRTMRLQYTMQDEHVLITDGTSTAEIVPVLLKPIRSAR